MISTLPKTESTNTGSMPLSREQPMHEHWPHADWARKQSATHVRSAIEKRAQGQTDAINDAIIAAIRKQREPATLDTDPEEASAVKLLLEANGLTEEIEAKVAKVDCEQERRRSEEHPLYLKPEAKAEGADALIKLAGDREPTKIGKDKLDANSLKNVAIFLVTNGIDLWHNEFDHKDYLRVGDGNDTRLTDEATLDLKMRMHTIGLRVTSEFCHDALKWIAQKNAKHPVCDYFNKHTWDSKPRLDKLLSKYFGAEDNAYHQLVGSKALIAAVRRVRKPGCKFDNMLVLEGPQGGFKSTGARTLSGDDWFTDGMAIGSNAKETIELTCGKLIVETAELAGLSKRDVNEVKQALSKQSDNARLAYGRLSTEVPRQFIFIGTTNNAQYLRDKTGNRRFWCVTVGKIDIPALRRDRNQIWAEAAHREKQGERIHLEDAEYDLAIAEQAKRTEDDELEITLDDLLGDFDEGCVTKRSVYAALGHDSVARASGSVGARVLDGMARRGWVSERQKVEGRRQWCFSKGGKDDLPPLLVYDEDTRVFRKPKKPSGSRTLH